MNAIRFPASVQDVHYVNSTDGQGEDAIISLRTSVIGRTRDVLSVLNQFADFEVVIKRRNVYEQTPVVGTVSAASAPGTFKFLMPPQIEENTGLALGTFVVTEKGVVAVIVGMKVETGELFRMLVQTNSLHEARLLAEQPVAEYSCIEVGGLGVDIDKGPFVYYHRPVWPPMPGHSVHVGPGGSFFDLSAANPQATQLYIQLTTIASMREVDPSVAAYMIQNVARFAKMDADDVRADIVSPLFTDFPTRAFAINAAFETMFPASLT